ncbi:BON domain-containing protein [Streptomyces sp. NPDC059991]|uniref:BON domain-containing protein n=1 Tax=Streptomyces sp. NPDC059991 TaxID=3347028 RepID=UPI0036A56F1F
MSAGGTLEGVVSRGDLLKVFLRSDRDLAAQIRREVVVPLFPLSHRDVGISVTEGVVTLSGAVRDRRLIPVAAHLAEGVEGVVGVECELTAPLSAS